MLNENYKQTAIHDLEKANDQYVQVFRRVVEHMSALYRSRQRAVKSICGIENYVSKLANKPRDYETKLGEIHIKYLAFNNRIEEIRQLDEKEKQGYYDKIIGIGVLAGAGSSVFMPTAAMSIAMTLGTASTGSAITSLSGITATNAALAWLGGGTLAAGGAGVAGGEAVLAMAGPIGWAIGGAVIASGFLWKAVSNSEIAKKAELAAKTILQEKERIQEIDAVVISWNKETIKLSNELTKKLTMLRRKQDYISFSENEKKELAIVMNMTEVLSKKLGETVR